MKSKTIQSYPIIKLKFIQKLTLLQMVVRPAFAQTPVHSLNNYSHFPQALSRDVFQLDFWLYQDLKADKEGFYISFLTPQSFQAYFLIHMNFPSYFYILLFLLKFQLGYYWVQMMILYILSPLHHLLQRQVKCPNQKQPFVEY